ncbi:MAG: VOC family protein [Candidatus Heimdallarchaeota archaeon]|nr:VOC family protein [Candidatus Heimdallarchaeota archaeon]
MKQRVVEIQVHTYDLQTDINFLRSCCGAKKTVSISEEEGTLLAFENSRIRLFTLEGESNYCLDDIGNSEILIEHQPGWRRIAVACSDLDETYSHMLKNGARTILPPTKIISGLKEAMVVTPSGLVIQPVKQQLWKLIPYMGLRWIKSNIFRISM